MKIKGKFHFSLWRKGVKIHDFDGHNLITTEGLNKILDVMFHGTTQITTWYIGLVGTSGFTGFNVADVMNSHGGWTEFTDYDEANRQAFVEGAASAGAIAASSASVFTISASGAVGGFFVTSDSTKSGTTGTLWAEAAFNIGNISVSDDDVINVEYTVEAS